MAASSSPAAGAHLDPHQVGAHLRGWHVPLEAARGRLGQGHIGALPVRTYHMGHGRGVGGRPGHLGDQVRLVAFNLG